MCAVQTKNMCSSHAYYVVTQGCKKVNNSKSGRFSYELIGETQPEMVVLESVAFIYALPKASSSILSATERTQHCCIICAVLKFSLKKPCHLVLVRKRKVITYAL